MTKTITQVYILELSCDLKGCTQSEVAEITPAQYEVYSIGTGKWPVGKIDAGWVEARVDGEPWNGKYGVFCSDEHAEQYLAELWNTTITRLVRSMT